MRVKIGDLIFGPEERKAINELMDKSTISEGARCKEFEEKFARFIGTDRAIVAANGTATLMLVMYALRYHSKYMLKGGEKVVTTPLTYIATSNSIVTTGYEPVYVDINLEDFSISTEQIKAHMEDADDAEQHRAVMPVHLMGYPCDMDEINKIATRYNMAVVEDAAEAHGSLYKGRRTGSLGLAGSYSFYIAHNIQAGEFGAITTNDQELANICKRMKGNGRLCYCTVAEIEQGKCPHQNLGFHPRYLHDVIGFNFKAMEYQAAIAILQLAQIDWILSKRRENVKHLNDALAPLEGTLTLPKHSDDISYLGYPMILTDKSFSRNGISKQLTQAGIENRPVFNCIPTQQPAYAFLKKKYEGKLPNAEFIGNNGFYVGCHQYLKDEELDYIAATLKRILSK
ncbi:MAG: DegT/DnrJ/EryC1/StrS family aminotransferase [Candidatus Aenigmarchaeota archaeon]|nr:DegT/DnrJ/EryC1/StrS family aminotransferase [Candidatus Aenigmarchaeota archaeon]